jgi:YHS domain-containing protein
MTRSPLLSLPVFALTIALVGCSNSPPPPPAVPPTPATSHDDHAKASARGGVIAEIGEVAHAEAVFEADGTVRLYLLGKDAKAVIEIDAKPFEAFATPDGSRSAVRFEFTPLPQPGDAAGKSSLFVGQLPAVAVGKPVGVSVPNLRVGVDRYRVGFHSPEGSSHEAMPAKRPEDEADKLFTTAGGLYTDADIKANGTRTPGEKYKGIRAKHDTEPKPGDKICPISETLANPQFTWVIGGKTYEFCCTPCIEEFVAAAKEKPSTVQPPDSYRKK